MIETKNQSISSLNKIAFLDRDGVINVKMLEGCYVTNWSQFKFRNGALSGIKLLNNFGYKVIIVTNQRCIARKIITEHELNQIHKKMIEAVADFGGEIEAIYYCPHDLGECICRKPDIGLFLQAEKVYVVDKVNSFMIGDSVSDVEAGRKYGIQSYLLKNSESVESLVKKILKIDK
ncbi:D-glycero-alpha-D-manno-heptose-1,7-bisphosphate 7-phosphatase [Anaerosinus massiliensis]|uniref:D-glycero-alpha-D-manno-heptose-1,7-bisphosphate 7-phosphatase n=1 Tax=Massilibacillus massiliensis TaxID=1806837 RepID=UPI000B2D3896|nr:HAD family hydrolase [Massilibacillus massiliensis]